METVAMLSEQRVDQTISWPIFKCPVQNEEVTMIIEIEAGEMHIKVGRIN